ncbi:radical SAM protein [Pyrococcus abyssi]|uniref:Pyruvate formate-lyase activating enzyme n=1 Tax=Pyrococcus abyssi (strain GE5 / Orsay) TaxID=272844 RepID=Q9UZM6_PYRAB|nr:radical SAM protein [Pyrococcus abyssi]CAB50031.1 pflX pyruvate formate-lyase activating enzyme [Pyrococcus abyssi GE5]CCE70533.1 TPA: pyruvate formate-lyase activating enzyme [Pyrococcus abyssi GE5]
MGAREALPKYFAILEGDDVPNFMLAKKVEVKPEDSIEEMWNSHEEGMDKLRENDIKDNPSFSLLDLKAVIANKILESCTLCEIKCRVNRKESVGYCRVKETLIASDFLHYGEEPELVPSYTVFFSGCNFRCVFCQNWDISQFRVGLNYRPEYMALKIERAYRFGAKNVNFVGGEPTPNLPFILETLRYVNVPIPVVWNSNMYMSEDSMKLLDGIVDIYLGDFKYGNDRCALKYSKVPRYWEVVTRNFLLAKNHFRAEFLIRHLVMPNHLECCTRPILKWISENLGKDVRVNVMFQYRPEYKAMEYEEISRMLVLEEMEEAERLVREFGLKNALVG